MTDATATATRATPRTEVVDADTHVVESAQIFELLDPSLYGRRPVLVRLPNDTLYGSRNATWLIDGQIVPKPAGVGGFRLHSPSAAEFEQARSDTRLSCRELTSVEDRLEDMDALGVTTQIVYPTLFLVQLTADPALELGLCRAYNRWMGRVSEQSSGRIRWIFVPAVQSLEETVADLEGSRQQGAAGVLLHGIEDHKSLADPYFFPLYEAARRLGLPICIHTGSGSPAFRAHLRSEISASFYHFTLPVLVAFRDIVANELPARFPGLRFGFIEAGASWLPFVLNHLARGQRAVSTPAGGGLFADRSVDPGDPSFLAANGIFVACLSDEDIPYLCGVVGEDNLIIGSDYGHIDQAFEQDLPSTLRARKDVSEATIGKILGDNARRFYGL